MGRGIIHEPDDILQPRLALEVPAFEGVSKTGPNVI